jgi:nuclear transport factor 2 (NTF2) superfamily protein
VEFPRSAADSRAYGADSLWRNRAEFFSGRPAIVEFLKRKWAREGKFRWDLGRRPDDHPSLSALGL